VRQVFDQPMQCGQCEVEGRSPWIASLADSFLQGHGSLHQAGGGLECSSTCHRPEDLALLEHVEDTVRSFFSGFTGTMRYGFAIVTDSLTVHQTDPVAIVFEPCIERLPRATGGLHGDQQPLTMVFVQVSPEGGLKELASLTGVCQGQFAAADASRRTHTSMVFGFAYIDSNKEPGSLLNIRFTLLGGSSILCQSHGTLLLV
jgi:hypothetical protein